MPHSYFVNLLFHLPFAEYLVELREYGPVYSTWGGLEVELSEPLEGVSACIGNCCTALEELSEDMTEDFLPVLREYILYSESMKVESLVAEDTVIVFAWNDISASLFFLTGRRVGGGKSGEVNNTLSRRMFS